MKTSRNNPKRTPHKTKKKARYKIKNWAAYNKALKQRGNITVWVSADVVSGWYYRGPQRQGGQFIYSDVAIETGLKFKGIYHLPLRQTQGFADSLFRALGVPITSPDYTRLSRRGATVTPSLQASLPSRPMALVFDSTGLKVYGEGEWKTRMHGISKRRTWRKFHLAVNANDHQIQATEVTANSSDDASQVKPLLQPLDGKPIESGRGDGAYDKQSVYRELLSRGIVPIIPPREDALIHPDIPEYSVRNKAIADINRRSRKYWKRNTGYHKRSLAETAFFRYKTIIGDRLKARKLDNQKTEVTIGCAILNRMAQIGMPVSYKVAA